MLIPTLDTGKHYAIGDDEVEKLIRKGEGWLAEHPEKETIVRRYLKHRHSLVRDALEQLTQAEEPEVDEVEERHDREEEAVERKISLHEQRLGAVLAALKGSGAHRVLDLGCGEGRLLGLLLKERQFTEHPRHGRVLSRPGNGPGQTAPGPSAAHAAGADHARFTAR